MQMKPLLLVVLVLVLSLSLSPTQAQVNKCLSYEEKLLDGSPGFCAGILPQGYRYLGNTSFTQEQLEGQALQAITQDNPAVGQLLLLLPSSCTTQLKRAACLARFPRCRTIHPYFLNAAPDLTALPANEAGCDLVPGTEWDDVEGECGVPVPTFPCRAECSDVGTASPAGPCPLVSGLFYDSLIALRDSHPDAAVGAEASGVLALQGCDTGTPAPDGDTPESECRGLRFTFNLLRILGFAPACEDREVTPGDPGTLELYPDGTQGGLEILIDTQIGVLTECGPIGDEASVTCNSIREVYGCEAPPASPGTQFAYDIAPQGSTCANVVRNAANQDDLLAHVLASADASEQTLPADVAGCLLDGKMNRYDGIYFVPPEPGMPPAATQLDTDGVEVDVDTWNETACPVEREPTPKYSNTEAALPLCTSSVQPSRTGHNARDCLQITVDDSMARFPRFAPWRCTLAFQEYLCAQAQMKPTLRHICLVPEEQGGCNVEDAATAFAENRLAFSAPLPRFPSRDTCSRFASECAALLPALGLEGLDCDAPLNITECSNENIGVVWGCGNSFNGLPAFPAGVQVFANVSTLGSLGAYIDALALGGLTVNAQAALAVPVAEATVSEPLTRDLSDAEAGALQASLCNCPAPLVVPDDPNGETLSAGTCCALPCIGSMFTQDDMEVFGKMQFALSLTGVVLMLFMLTTLLVFEEKRKQYMQFWMAICSFFISLSFLLMAARPDWDLTANLCKDNSTPNTLKDAGFTLNVAQSIMLIFFATALCGWWLCQAVDLFRKLVRGTRNTEASKPKYHIFVWGVAFVETAALVGLRALGFKPPTPWSFVDGSSELEFALFYAFIGFCFVTGTLCMISVIYVIIQTTRKTRNLTTGSGGKRGLRQFKLYRTPLLFVAAFIVVWCDIFTFRFSNFFSEDDYRADAEEWVGCLLSRFLLGVQDPATQPGPNGEAPCGLTQPNGLNFAFLQFTFVIVMSQSLILFLVFGTPARNYTLWLEKFGCRQSDSGGIEPSEGSFNSKDTSSKGHGYSFQLSSSYQSGAGQAPYSPGDAAGGASPYGTSSRNPAFFGAAATPPGAPPRAPPGLPPSPRGGQGYY